MKELESLPNATEAAARIIQGKYDEAKRQAARVSQAIQKAIESGQRSITISEALVESVKEALRVKGYAHKYEHDFRDGGYTTISW